MGNPLRFDYFYGIESEQFSFYRVPRLLIRDEHFKGLSSDAKLLYGLMLDRMALSRKNGWIDKENRAYIIYSVEEVMEELGCSKPTCIKIMRELDSERGIGLIEKIRRGLGKPDIIYVKNFVPVETETSGNTESAPEVKKLYFCKEKNFTSGSKKTELLEVKESDLQREKGFTSEGKITGLQEVKGFSSNNTYINQTDLNQTYLIHQSPDGEGDKADGIEDETAAYIALIRANLEYEHHMKYAEQYGDSELFEEIYETICEVVCVKRKTIRINGEEYPYELVRSRFLKLNSSHVEYVMACLKDTTVKIGNIRAYLLTALYNAAATMNLYYQQEVQHDRAEGG